MMLTDLHHVEITVVPPGEMRYSTVGDWQFNQGVLRITVPDPDGTPITSVLLVAVHELVEAVLCDQHGVTGQVVDAFDTSPDRMGSPYEDEPGLDPSGPYHREHTADLIERMVAQALGVPWAEHEAQVDVMARAVDGACAEKSHRILDEVVRGRRRRDLP